MWATTFGTNFDRHHPAFVTLVNGEHAVIGPCSFSTSSTNGPTQSSCRSVAAAWMRWDAA